MRKLLISTLMVILASGCSLKGGTYYKSEFCDELGDFAVVVKMEFHSGTTTKEEAAIEKMKKSVFSEEQRQLFTKVIKYTYNHLYLNGDDLKWNVSHSCSGMEKDDLLNPDVPFIKV